MIVLLVQGRANDRRHFVAGADEIDWVSKGCAPMGSCFISCSIRIVHCWSKEII